MKLSDFDFTLPEDLIALRPIRPRSAARLLAYEGGQGGGQNVGRICHDSFASLRDYLRPNDRLILNETKVIPARLKGMRSARSASNLPPTSPADSVKIEVTLLSMDTKAHWLALAKPAKRLRLGDEIMFRDESSGASNGDSKPDLRARVEQKNPDGAIVVSFNKTGEAFDQALAHFGELPLPPYIANRRAVDSQDQTDYQTVFAKRLGAVAAPTASLHFTQNHLTELQKHGIQFSKVTLHVGAGTFLPVKTEDIKTHKMHAEWGELTAQTAIEIRQTQAQGGRIIPVGTTSLRLLETAALGGQVRAFCGNTDIFIAPGFKFNATDGLITNFHLPKSTLLMLVAALIGLPAVKQIYQQAIDKGYRFFSYGDSSLLIP